MLALTLAACMALAACGPLGDDDPEPTATSESLAQPTDAATEEATTEATEDAADSTAEAEATTDLSTPIAPPDVAASTPDLEPISGTVDSIPESTPVFNDIVTTASPAAGDRATPVVPPSTTAQDDGPPPDGDGTSGAFPVVTEEAEEASLLIAETPEDAQGTPDSSPVAVTGTLEDLEVLAVTSCEPEFVPVIELESTAYRTVSDVNIRFGPGADCETLAVSPIGEFMPVTLIGGPVQREDEDFVWVQVEVSGEIGWVVVEALEPIEV